MNRTYREVVSSALRNAALLFLLAAPGVTAQDAGYEGPSYTGANSFPSGTKPESKLWFNDGIWWACLWSTAAQSYSIHRLDGATHQWSDTGALVDARPISRSDCRWNGTKLYISSHRWNPGGGNAGHPLVVYRYAYDPVTEQYALDPGFPVEIADSSAETVVLDQDSAGTSWAVWMRDLRLRVSHTLGDDRAWSAPVIHPENAGPVTIDDVGSVVHFDGNKLGVMWSDQVAFAYWFSYHVDGDPDTAWSPAVPLLSGIGDDHINLKASSDGRVFATLKTLTNEIHLGVRATDGTWTTHLISDAAAGWTRAICMLDEAAREVHVFATSPVIAGTIFEKVSSMDTIAFPGGIGTAAIRDADDPQHNDTTGCKQVADGDSGLVVIACHQPTERYWHHEDDLGGPVPSAPDAAAAADPRTGYDALTVRFHDTSRHAATSWFWTFGDGATSTEQHPVHTYTVPGTYDVALTASNGLGDDTIELEDWITVQPAPLALTLTALEDAQVNSGSPDNSYGALPEMRVRAGSFHSFIEFLVPDSQNAIVSAHLRLFANDGGPDAGTVFTVDPSWQEPFVTWNTAPAIGGTPVGNLGSVGNNAWAELDVSSAVTTGGVIAFGLTSSSTNSVFYSTREGANPPELVLTLESTVAPPEASFDADTTSGLTPLTVHFTDTSTNDPTSWLWSFGDGSTSTEQHPAHVYTIAGLYSVSLTAINAEGFDVESRVGYIDVQPGAPLASFSVSASHGTAPLSVQFTDESANAPTSWSWDFGDGQTSDAQNPEHVFAEPGSYLVTLTASNAFGSDDKQLLIHAQRKRVVRHAPPVGSYDAPAGASERQGSSAETSTSAGP